MEYIKSSLPDYDRDKKEDHHKIQKLKKMKEVERRRRVRRWKNAIRVSEREGKKEKGKN